MNSHVEQDSSGDVASTCSPSTDVESIKYKTMMLSEKFDLLNTNLLAGIESLLANLPKDGTAYPRSDYIRDISDNNSCQYYLHYYTELYGLVRSAEKSVRVAQRSLKLEQGSSRVESISQAVDLIKQCMSYIHAMKEIEERVDIKAMVSDGLCSRAREAAGTARSVISAGIQECLKLSQWPPPLLPSSSNTSNWNGFEQAGDDVFRELQQLIVMMISLQMAVEYQSFSNLNAQRAEDIVLWPAIEFSTAIKAWIGSHFAPNMPTCRIEKPEWLFSAVLYAARKCSLQVDIFDGCIETHGIQQYFSMGIEIGKCVYMDGLYKVVKGVYLPLMFEERDASYVLHYVDEAIVFERKYRGLRVDPLISDDVDAVSHRKSMIEILFENEDWASQWLKYEGEEARQRMYTIANDSLGWKSHTTMEQGVASLHEFTPSLMISNATEVLIDMLDRTKYIHQGTNKLLWCHRVVKSAIATLTSHMQSELVRTEQFEHLIDDIGMPIISGCLNGLHYLEHMMTEPGGTLLEAFISSPEMDTFLEQQANSLSVMRRKWTNTIVSMSMKFVLSSFLELTDEDPVEEHEGPSPSIIRVRNQISELLNEFSKHLDQVIFREVWKGIALSTSDSFLEDLQSANKEMSEKSLRDSLNVLVSAFSSFTSNPEAYFRHCYTTIDNILM